MTNNETTQVPALGTDGLPYHTQPLRALVRELHKGRSVRELAVKLRYRRRKVKALDTLIA